MTRLLHISDPHFGSERPEVVEALVSLAQQRKPDMLVLSGDITQRARMSQFQRARTFIDRLEIEYCLAIPGNHDLPLFNLFSRILRPYAHHCRHFGPSLEPWLSTADVLVIGVNTTRTWRHKDGEVSTIQIEQVAQQLAQASSRQLRIVVTHQPVHVYRDRDAHNLLHGCEVAIRRWAQAGADLILGGHIHLPYVRALHEAHSGLARRIWCVQAGTAVSSRVRPEAPNSVNWIEYQPFAQPFCQIERWDYRAGSGFALAETTPIALERPHIP